MDSDEKNEKSEKNHLSEDDAFDYAEIQRMLPEQFENLYKTYPLTEDTSCGFWFFQGNFMQK